MSCRDEGFQLRPLEPLPPAQEPGPSVLAWPSLSEEEGPPARSAPLAAQAEGRAARGSPLRAPATPPLTRLPPRAGLQAQAGLPSSTPDLRPPAFPRSVSGERGAWPAETGRAATLPLSTRPAGRCGPAAGRGGAGSPRAGRAWVVLAGRSAPEPQRSVQRPEPAQAARCPGRARCLLPGRELPAPLPAALTPSPPAWPRLPGARGA